VASLVFSFGGQAAVTLLMPFYLIQARGLSTAEAGIVIGTVPALMLLVSPFSGYLADRTGSGYQAAVGAALVSLGLLSLATLGAETPLALVMGRLAIVGLGTALFQAPNSSAIMGSVPRERLGTASASVATARNIGNASGLALAGTLLVVVAARQAGVEGVRADELPPDALLAGIRAAFLAAAAVSSLAIVTALLRGGASARAETDQEIERQPSRPVASR
jgi:MFS family permease